MDINYPSRVKVRFHGDYDTKVFDYDEKVPLAFIIESYILDRNDDDEVFLSIQVKFISNIDESVETAIHHFEEEGKYLGELKNGTPHGRGVFFYNDDQRYAGDFIDGKFNGEGIYVFSDNHRYTGKWKDGLKHGEGTYIWTDGSRYSGSWENDLMNGRGTYTESDGRSWTGQWSNDKPLNAPQWLKEIFSDEEE
jgi:hypothetical protein